MAKVGMLKKATSGVLALLPDLRAHRLAALRGVRAHVLRVRSARQKGCGLAGWTFLNNSLSLRLVAFPGAFMGSGHEIFNRPKV